MSAAQGLNPFLSIGVACLLLYLEESGLPLPIAPGEAVLVALGLLVAREGAAAWLAIPIAYLAVVAGVLTGFTWSRLIGPERVRAVAARLHATGPYDRAAERLRAAGLIEIAGSRLLPGLRVYTSLVAGAVGVDLRLFLLAILPAVAVWVLAFVLLGVFVGVPAERLLGRFEGLALRAGFILGLIVAALLVVRRIPAAQVGMALRRSHARPRTVLALAVDAVTVGIVVVLLSLLTEVVGGETDSIVSAAGIFAVLALLYLAAARRTVGFTIGEALLDVSYRR